MDYMNWTDLQVATGNFITNQELDPHSYDDGFGEFQLRDTFLYKINEGIDPAKLLLSRPAAHGLPNASEADAAEEGRSRGQSIPFLPCHTAGTHAAQLQLDPPNMWEMYFEILLFLFNSFELKEIWKKMEEDYGFHASIKQYKTQISQWQKEGRFPPKHIKRADMEAMASVREQRTLDGKQTVFFYRGWRIDDLKIKRFISRFGVNTVSSPTNLPGHITSQTPPPMGFFAPASAGFGTALDDPPSMSSQKRLKPQCTVVSQVNTPASSEEQIYALEEDAREDSHRKLASQSAYVLTSCTAGGRHNADLESPTATPSQWNSSPHDARNPSPIWPSILPEAASTHMSSMKESHIEASTSPMSLLSRPSREPVLLCQENHFVEPPHPSFNLPSAVSEHAHYQKDVSDSFNIPNNYCLIDSEMLEPPNDTHSTASGDEPDTLEDCQTLVSCIFEFLQTTQPRRYELQAQLTIICEDLLKVIQMEKEKRIDITAALKSAERDRKDLMDECRVLFMRKKVLMDETKVLLARNKVLRDEYQQLERRKTLQELAMSEVYSPIQYTNSRISDAGHPRTTSPDTRSH